MGSGTACPVCESTANGSVSEGLIDRRKGLPGSWTLVDCTKCGCTFMNPMPTDAELTTFYDAYLPDSELTLSAGTGSKHPALRRGYHLLSGDVDPRDFVDVPQGGKVLDYGSGDGNYLSFFHSRGVDIVGAEISDPLIRASREAGLTMTKVADFDRVPFPDATFDVVYLIQVFEHLREPRRFMAELSRVLKPGGTLYLAVPNASSAWRRLFGRNWVSGWFAPFHLVHYTAKSLGLLGSQFGLVPTRSWSRTPESWMRLNVKASIHQSDRTVERRRAFPDALPIRLVLMTVTRLIDVFLRERDCLVVTFTKT